MMTTQMPLWWTSRQIPWVETRHMTTPNMTESPGPKRPGDLAALVAG